MSNAFLDNLNFGSGSGTSTLSNSPMGSFNTSNSNSGIFSNISNSLFGNKFTADSLKWDAGRNMYLGPNNSAFAPNGQPIGGSQGGFLGGNAGSLISGLLGFLGQMQQANIAKKQLKLGKEQLASSKASYALDAKTQAEQYNREWRNRMESLSGGIGNTGWINSFVDNPQLASQIGAEVDQSKRAYADRAEVPLIGESTMAGLDSWLNKGGLGGTGNDAYVKALSSYAQPSQEQQALTQQTPTTYSTTVKKPEEQLVRG